MTRLKVGILGARRVRQGLGPVVAREFHRHGAEITAVLTSGMDTLALARAEITELIDAEPRGYLDVGRMLGVVPAPVRPVVTVHH